MSWKRATPNINLRYLFIGGTVDDIGTVPMSTTDDDYIRCIEFGTARESFVSIEILPKSLSLTIKHVYIADDIVNSFDDEGYPIGIPYREFELGFEDKYTYSFNSSAGPYSYIYIVPTSGDFGDFYYTLHADQPSKIISYNANGGTGAPQSQAGATGSVITLSTVRPTRTGYNFLGWSTNSAATSATYQPGGNFTVGSSDVTLYAVWEAKVYTVNFYAHDTLGAYATVAGVYGQDLFMPVTPNVPGNLENGYFVGWVYKNSTSTTATWTSGSRSILDEEDQSWYAVWHGDLRTKNTNTPVVVYGDTIYIRQYYYDNNSQLKTNTTSGYRETYTNSQTWYYDQSYNFTLSYHSGIRDDIDTTYYRLVNAGNVGSWSTTIPALKVTASLNSPSSLVKNYGFVGWSTSSQGVSIDWSSGSYTSSETMSFYAVISGYDGSHTENLSNEIKHYFYNSNASQSASIFATEVSHKRYIRTYTNDFMYYDYTGSNGVRQASGTNWTDDSPVYDILNAPSTSPSKSGYKFEGWTNDDISYTANFVASRPTSSTNWYATWSKVVSLKYESDYGTIPSSQTQTRYLNYSLLSYSDVSFTLANALTAEGHSFSGWEIDGTVYSASQIYTVPVEKYVVIATANWGTNTYSIYFYSNNSSEFYKKITASYGDSISLPETPSTPQNLVSGRFLGWTKNSDKTSIDSSDWSSGTQTVSSGQTWYAVWYGSLKVSDERTDVESYSTVTATLKVDGVQADKSFISHLEKYSDEHNWYYNQNFNYTLSRHSGELTTDVNWYYRLIDPQGSSTDWGSTEPSIILTVPISAPEKNGYSFVGWVQNNPDSTVATWTKDSKTFTSNTTWYAVWKNNNGTHTQNFRGSLSHKFYSVNDTVYDTRETEYSYMVTYYNDTVYYNYRVTIQRNTEDSTDGTAGERTYESMSPPVNPINPSSLYTFVGWSSSKTNRQTSVLPDKPTTDTTWYAVWSSQVTLNYVSTHGTIPPAQTKTRLLNYNLSSWDNVSFVLADALVSQGNTFVGWDISGMVYSQRSTYTSYENVHSITATAKWYDGYGNYEVYIIVDDTTTPVTWARYQMHINVDGRGSYVPYQPFIGL